MHCGKCVPGRSKLVAGQIPPAGFCIKERKPGVGGRSHPVYISDIHNRPVRAPLALLSIQLVEVVAQGVDARVGGFAQIRRESITAKFPDEALFVNARHSRLFNAVAHDRNEVGDQSAQ